MFFIIHYRGRPIHNFTNTIIIYSCSQSIGQTFLSLSSFLGKARLPSIGKPIHPRFIKKKKREKAPTTNNAPLPSSPSAFRLMFARERLAARRVGASLPGSAYYCLLTRRSSIIVNNIYTHTHTHARAAIDAAD